MFEALNLACFTFARCDNVGTCQELYWDKVHRSIWGSDCCKDFPHWLFLVCINFILTFLVILTLSFSLVVEY